MVADIAVISLKQSISSSVMVDKPQFFCFLSEFEKPGLKFREGLAFESVSGGPEPQGVDVVLLEVCLFQDVKPFFKIYVCGEEHLGFTVFFEELPHGG